METAICAAGFADQILLGVGGEAVGDDLHADVAAGGDDVDRGLAVGVGLDLQIALVLAVLSMGWKMTAALTMGLPLDFLTTVTSMCEVLGGSLVLAAARVWRRPAPRRADGTEARAEETGERRPDGAA